MVAEPADSVAEAVEAAFAAGEAPPAIRRLLVASNSSSRLRKHLSSVWAVRLQNVHLSVAEAVDDLLADLDALLDVAAAAAAAGVLETRRTPCSVLERPYSSGVVLQLISSLTRRSLSLVTSPNLESSLSKVETSVRHEGSSARARTMAIVVGSLSSFLMSYEVG